jgi:hypothetical protein
VIELIHSRHLKRRTQHERLGEMPNKTKLWNQLFSIDKKEFGIFNVVRLKIEERAKLQIKEQEIGKIREEKVLSALESLKKKKEIKDFVRTKKFSKLDLMYGIDFEIIYIDKKYNVFDLSVTGQKWIAEHEKSYPEISVLVVYLEESISSIEKKILELIDRRKKLC